MEVKPGGTVFFPSFLPHPRKQLLLLKKKELSALLSLRTYDREIKGTVRTWASGLDWKEDSVIVRGQCLVVSLDVGQLELFMNLILLPALLL